MIRSHSSSSYSAVGAGFLGSMPALLKAKSSRPKASTVLARAAFTSSGAGIIGIKGSPAYTAAKHGVIGLTRAAALDYAAQNIRVNAVCPGYIDTPMMGRFTGGTPEGRAKVIAEEPVGRMGKPEEIAAAVVWLCSDTAAFVTGHAMVIDGGQTA